MAFDTVLIANRGEIAVRVAQACRELGLRSVAVYSQADAGALHTRTADEAMGLGPAEARESYLHIERILAAAQRSGAQAVHPGYGFLAENAEFAEAVQAAGMVWIGPAPVAMRAMGDKAGARELMLKAGVPVLPGYQGADIPAALKKAANEVGFPLLVKAAAGGGGMGQRVVSNPAELDQAIASARGEAQRSFGSERLILEKYLERARHVEVQVLGDTQGKLLHLFERECSLQRRRQKLVEESPSPFLDETLRAEMGAAAVAAARSVDYVNAGTVEFLVDPDTREFYFLEMNTRIQVEHPVTELVTGVDLVQWQLRIAAGEPLPFAQADLRQSGHAIECRVYAEDPAAGFLPQAGQALRLAWPQTAGLRVDAAVAQGDAVGSSYDPILAKLIVHAEDRRAALAALREALAASVLLGVTHNMDFLQDLLAHPKVAAGEFDTGFVEREMAEWQPAELTESTLLAALSIEMGVTHADDQTTHPYSPWDDHQSFRLGGS